MPLVESFHREPSLFIVLLALFLCGVSVAMSMGFRLLAISEITGYNSHIVSQLRLAKAACETKKKASEVCRVDFIPVPKS